MRDETSAVTATRQPTFMTGIALLLPITLTTMAIVLLAPVMPLLLAEFSHVPNHEYWVPMVLTFPALCVAILCPLAGILGDYFGKRKLLLASFVVYAIVGVAPVFLTDLTMILISRIGVGVAEALIYVLSTTMIADVFHGETRDRWLAAQPAFASMSALLFFNLGGLLGEIGWRTPFWVYGSALIMFVLVWRFTWEPEKPRRDVAVAGKGMRVDANIGQTAHRLSWEGFPWGKMATIVLITVYGSVFFYTVQIQASSGLAELGMVSPAEAGFWTSVASVGVPLGTIIYGRWGTKVAVARLLLVAFALLAAGFFAMGTAAGTTQFLLGCFVNQLGAGMLLPTLLVWAMSVLPFEVRCRGTGFWQSAFALGQWLSPLIVTFFALRLGGLLSSLQVLSYFAATGALITVVVSIGSRKPRPVAGA